MRDITTTTGGYDGYSMSNRARDAYDYGLMPAGKLARLLGVRTEAVREVLRPSEWHHTSSRYNATDFYRMPGADDELEPAELWAVADALADADARLRSSARAERTGTATIEWMEWGGTRKHPTPIPHTSTGPARQKGDWIYFAPAGREMKKKASGNHITITWVA